MGWTMEYQKPLYYTFDLQNTTTAFVALLWEVAVCILMCIERGNGACLLSGTMAPACLVPPWLLDAWCHDDGATLEESQW